MSQIQKVLECWLNDVGPSGWYVSAEDVDNHIRVEFSTAVDQALEGALDDWCATPDGTLALLILLDQFPRNLHRGKAAAFAGDEQARNIARVAVCKNLDLEIAEPGRQFFYLPFEHSESLADQDWSVTLFKTRMTTIPDESMWHIEQHREMIRRFGRFPFRNEALDRTSTVEESAFLAEGGYRPGLKS